MARSTSLRCMELVFSHACQQMPCMLGFVSLLLRRVFSSCRGANPSLLAINLRGPTWSHEPGSKSMCVSELRSGCLAQGRGHLPLTQFTAHVCFDRMGRTDGVFARPRRPLYSMSSPFFFHFATLTKESNYHSCISRKWHARPVKCCLLAR